MAVRYYTVEDMGLPCRVCRIRVPKRLAADVHPCCAPDPRQPAGEDS